MKKICLQSGHYNAGGGAPNELVTNKRITDRVSTVLRARGFEVYQTDSNGDHDPKVTSTDWDLFLALHCDMDYPGDNGSGFSDFPEPKTDGATTESQRIVKVINDNYFKETGIVYKNHSNGNTRYYYMWASLTGKTPCALLEMGQSVDPHDSILLANTDLIANAIGRCICKAFNMPFDLTPPPVTPPTDPHLAEIEALRTQLKATGDQLEEAKRTIVSLKLENETKLAQAKRDCELNKGIVLNKLKEAESYLQ
jgi:hypothetical protein